MSKSFNQNSLTQPNNNDYEDGELDRNHAGSVAKSAYQKSSKQDKYNSQQFQQFESPSQQTGQKGSNLINQEIAEHVVPAHLGGSEDKADGGDGSKNHEEPEPESMELKQSQEDLLDQHQMPSQQQLNQQNFEQLSGEVEQNNEQPALLEENQKDDPGSPAQADGFSKYIDGNAMDQTPAQREPMLYGGALGNSQAVAAGASGEQMSGEEAEQNELAEYSSPYAGLENPHEGRKSLTKAQQSESFTQNIPDMNKTAEAAAANDEAMEDEENRYENEEPIESSGQSEVVDVQSGHLQPYIQAEREEYNEEMNHEDWGATQQQEFLPSPAKVEDDERSPTQRAAEVASGDQADESAREEFIDAESAPKEKYLEANQVTDTEKEFEAQQEGRQAAEEEDQEHVVEDDAEGSQLVDMNKQLNVASFDEVAGSPEQDQGEEFEEEQLLPRKKGKGGKRTGKKSAPARSKVLQEAESAVRDTLEEADQDEASEQLEVEPVLPKGRRGAASSRSKKSPQKSVASRATSKKQASKRGKSARSKKATEVQDSAQDEQPMADEENLGEELNDNLKELHEEYDQQQKQVEEADGEQALKSMKRGLFPQSDDDEPEPVRPVSTRKTRSARKAEEAAIQVMMHKKDENAKDTQESGPRNSRTRKGKNSKKSVSKKEAAPVVEDEEDNLDEKEAEGPAPDESPKDLEENVEMLDAAEAPEKLEEADKILEPEEQDLQQSAIVDMDQVQMQVQQDEEVAHHDEEPIVEEAEQEEPEPKPKRGKGKKKKSTSQKKRGKGRGKKAQVQQEEPEMHDEQNEAAEVQPDAVPEVKEDAAEAEEIQQEEVEMHAEDQDQKEDNEQDQIEEIGVENEQPIVGDATQSLSQNQKAEQEDLEDEEQNKAPAAEEDSAAQDKDANEAQQSDEEMPDIALIEDDAADQEEFDYADGKMANNDYDKNSYDESGNNKDNEDNEKIDQAQNDGNQEPIQSEESSDIRSVQVPHRDEPVDDDAEFINNDGMQPRGGTDSEESGDNCVMDDANNLQEDSPVEFANELAQQQDAEERPAEAEEGNDLCINNDLHLVLDEDPEEPGDDDDEERQASAELQEEHEENNEDDHAVANLMAQEQEEDDEDDGQFEADTPAKHSNQEQSRNKVNLAAGFDAIDLNEEEDSPKQELVEPEEQDKIIAEEVEEPALEAEAEVEMEDEKPIVKPKASKRKSTKKTKSTRKKAQKQQVAVQEDEEEELAPAAEVFLEKSEEPVEQQEEVVDAEPVVKAEDEEEQIEQSAAEPTYSDEEMVEDADEEADEQAKEEEEQIEESDEEEEQVVVKGKKSQSRAQAATRKSRKAGEQASLFMNAVSSILAEDYGNEELGDDEEEGEYEPPSQVSSESFPAASDSHMISEEFQIGEQMSTVTPLAQEAAIEEQTQQIMKQQSQKSQRSQSKQKSQKQIQSQKSQRMSGQRSKDKMMNQSLSQIVEEETRGRQSRSKLSQLNQVEPKQSSQVVSRKPTPRRSLRGEPDADSKIAKREAKASPSQSKRKQSQEEKAEVKEQERKLKLKPSNKQSFYIERISRRNKAKDTIMKPVDKSTPRSKSERKTQKTPSKSKEKDAGKKTPRSTRGRSAREADQQSEGNAVAASTQKVEQISDVVTDVAAVRALRRPKNQQPAETKAAKRAEPRSGRRNTQEQSESPQKSLKIEKKKSAKEKSVSPEPTRPLSSRRSTRADVVMADAAPTKQKSKEKVSKSKVQVEEPAAKPEPKQLKTALVMSPRKTRSGPRAVVVESPSKLGKRQAQQQLETSTKSKSKNATVVQATAGKKEVAIKVKDEQVKPDVREKSKDTTKKTSEKPSKASKQVPSKAETSLGLVAETEINQIASKKSKRSEPEAKKGAGFGFFDLEDSVPKQEAPSEQVLMVKKRGRPRKEAKEEPAEAKKAKKDKEEPASKRVKKSHSVGLEAAAREDIFQALFVEKKADSLMKKRGRPRKTPVPEEPVAEAPAEQEPAAAFGFAGPAPIVSRIIDDDEVPKNAAAKKSAKQTPRQSMIRTALAANQNSMAFQQQKTHSMEKSKKQPTTTLYNPTPAPKRELKAQQKVIERNLQYAEQHLVPHQLYENMFVPEQEPQSPLGTVWTLAPLSPTKSRRSPAKQQAVKLPTVKDLQSLKPPTAVSQSDIKNQIAAEMLGAAKSGKAATTEKKTGKKTGGKAMSKQDQLQTAQSSKSKMLKVSEKSKAIKKQRGRKSKDGLTMAQRKELALQKRLAKRAAKEAAKQAERDARVAKKAAKLAKKLNAVKQKEMKKKLKKEQREAAKQKIKAEKQKKKEAIRKAKEVKIQKEKELARKEKEKKKMMKAKEEATKAKEREASRKAREAERLKKEAEAKKAKQKALALAAAEKAKKEKAAEKERKQREQEELKKKKEEAEKLQKQKQQQNSAKKASKSKQKDSPEKVKTPRAKDSKKSKEAKSPEKPKAKDSKSKALEKAKQLKSASKKIQKPPKQDQTKVKQPASSRAAPKKAAPVKKTKVQPTKTEKVTVVKKISTSKKVTAQKEAPKRAKTAAKPAARASASALLKKVKDSVVKAKKAAESKKQQAKAALTKSQSQKSSKSKVISKKGSRK